MVDIRKFPREHEYADLKEYEKVLLAFFGAKRLKNIDIYQVWLGIKTRCNNPNYEHYHRYGGRGIKICDRWRESFLYFISDMGPRPTDEKYPSGISIWSIDRIDNDGNYEPDNCEWVTKMRQTFNTSMDIELFEYRGKLYSNGQLARMVNMNPRTLRFRIEDLKWSIEKAVTTPIVEVERFPHNGRMISIPELSEETGIKVGALHYRLKVKGMSVEEAIKVFTKEITFQDVTMTASGWFRRINNRSVSRETMSTRSRQGFPPGDILRPDSERHRVTKLYPTIIITIDGISTEYKDIIDAAETTGILLLDIVAELNKEDGYVIYKELRPDTDNPKYDEYTVTYQSTTRTINEWYVILGKHSVARYVMLERILEGLTGLQVLTPFIHGVVHPHPNYRLLDVTSVIDSKVVTYHNIIECSHITKLPLDVIVAELEKEDGYITYNSDHEKYDRLVNGKL